MPSYARPWGQRARRAQSEADGIGGQLPLADEANDALVELVGKRDELEASLAWERLEWRNRTEGLEARLVEKEDMIEKRHPFKVLFSNDVNGVKRKRYIRKT